MSANNFLLINRKTFEVTMRDAENNYILMEVGKGKDINEAIDIAQKCLREEIIEYGINFI